MKIFNEYCSGIDMSEVLQYPDFSSVVLYRKLGKMVKIKIVKRKQKKNKKEP